MAVIDPTTFQYSFIQEVTEGVQPLTPAMNLFSRIPGKELEYSSDMLDSQILRTNRTRGQGRKVNRQSTGGYDLEFAYTPLTAWAISSVLGATAVANVVTAGTTDVTATFEKKCSATEFQRHLGVRCKTFNLSAVAQEAAKCSIDLMGIKRVRGTAIIAGETYVAEPATPLFGGADITSILIGGVSYDIRSLELSITQDMKTRSVLGNEFAIGLNEGAFRDVSVKVEYYKNDYAADTLFEADAPVPVSFSALNGGKGMTFAIPSMQGAIVKDKDDGTDSIGTIELKAIRDSVSGSNIKVTFVP